MCVSRKAAKSAHWVEKDEWLRGVRPLLFVPAFGCASAPLPGYRAAMPRGADLHRRGFAVPSVLHRRTSIGYLPVAFSGRSRSAQGSRTRGWFAGDARSLRGAMRPVPLAPGGGRTTARISLVGWRGLVAVPEPTVSRPGVAPVACPAVGGRSSRAGRRGESTPARRGGRALSASRWFSAGE